MANSVARLGTKPQIGLLFDTSCAFFLRVALSHKLGYFSVLGELRLAKYYGDPKKLVSHISDFKIAGNSVIGQ